jgi:hypothetical protein
MLDEMEKNPPDPDASFIVAQAVCGMAEGLSLMLQEGE